MKRPTVAAKILITALVSLVCVPGIVSVGAKTDDSPGTVTFSQDDGSVNPPVDPEVPGEVIDPPYPPNPIPTALMIDGITTLDFKNQLAKRTDQWYFAEQVIIKEGGAIKGPRGNYLQFTDKRLGKTADNKSYTLSAQLFQQFETASGKKLAGASIKYENLNLESETDPTVSKWPILLEPSFILEEGAGEVEILKSETGQGFGTYTLEFGNTADYHAATGKGTKTDSTGTPSVSDGNKIENGSVTLFVPGNTFKTTELYTAIVKWSLNETI